MRIAAGAVAALVTLALAGCGSAHDPTRHQIAAYLSAVDKLERELGTPLTTVDTVDKQLTARSPGRKTTGTPTLTVAQEQARLRTAEGQINAVSVKLHALAAPAPAAHLKSLVVRLADQQGALTMQTRRLITFIPGFSKALRPLGPAVSRLEHVLSVSQAAGTTAVQAVYARKAAALRTFAGALGQMIATLERLTPPDSSRPTYLGERHSLQRMRAAASTLAGDLAGGHTGGVTAVLRQFDAAAAIPGSRHVQVAELAAVKAYDRRVSELDVLVGQANTERLQLAKRYP